MVDKLWKAAERRICEMLGGTRRGPMGRGESDCCHPWLAIEVKCRKKMPQYVKDWIGQAWVNADDKLPIVVWHEVGDWYEDAIVMMGIRDFLDWFNGSSAPGGDEQVAAALDGCEELPFDEPLEGGEG